MSVIKQLDDPVSVMLAFDAKARLVKPLAVKWSGRNYPILKVGLHHQYKEGNVLHHVFSVVSNDMFFKLNLNTRTLHWRLEEISDGLPD